jgi:omega-6 fatty acid desaturase (delta-12 desaturase)
VSSKIPHYHAEEGTQALKAFLGPYYLETDENVFVSLWKSHRECRFVDKEGDIVMYKDAYGRQRRKVEVVHPASDSGIEGI